MTSHLVVIELRAVEFVVPDEFPGLAFGGGRQEWSDLFQGFGGGLANPLILVLQ